MEGKWKILLVMLGLLVCFGLVYVIAGNGKQSSPEQIKKASMSKTEAVSQQKQEDVKEEDKREIYLAGGCFWGVEGYFAQLDGVLSTKVGYSNGQTAETTYQQIKTTDHAEVIYLKYDNSVLPLNDVLRHYFRIIDPVSINKQGGDRGRQYRTGIYYVDEETREEVVKFIEELQKNYTKKIAVEVEAVNNYIDAEEYHQKYLEKNPTGYCHVDLSLAKKSL